MCLCSSLLPLPPLPARLQVHCRWSRLPCCDRGRRMPSLCCGPKWLSLSAAVRAPPSAHAQASACVCACMHRVCMCDCTAHVHTYLHTYSLLLSLSLFLFLFRALCFIQSHLSRPQTHHELREIFQTLARGRFQGPDAQACDGMRWRACDQVRCRACHAIRCTACDGMRCR